MPVVKKTVSIPEDLYKESKKISNNFSKVISEALGEYIKSRKKEKLLSLAGALNNAEDGKGFVDKIRSEDLKREKKREKTWNT